MATTAQSVAVRFLPSLTDVAFILPLIFQFNQLGGAPTLLADGDTGWHLRTGEWILAHGQVPQQDLFSYTHAGKPWFAWEWLWDVSFGFLNQHFGLAAVVAASMLLLCFTSAMLYRLILRKCDNPLIAIALTGLGTAGASIHWLARPHLFTFFFIVLFLGILDRACVSALAAQQDPARIPERDAANRRLFWLLPALMVLWTNIHGGFVAGLIVIGAYAGGGLLGAVFESDADGRRAAFLRAKPFLLSGALCGLATLINPYFTGLHSHIVTYLLDPYLYEHIKEFMAFNFAHPASKYLEPLILLALAAACWNLYRRRFEYVVLLAGWLHLALHVRRNMALFAMICAPFVAEALQYWLRELESSRAAEWLKSIARRLTETGQNIAETDRLPRLHLASAAGIILTTAVLFAPQPPETFLASQDPKEFPVKAASQLSKDGDDHIFTSDVWGGYLIYRLYPKAKVFIDGRSDFYGKDFEVKYLDILMAKYNWDETLNRYDARTVLVPADAPLAAALKGNRRWRVDYDDQVAIIFRRVPGHPSQQVSNCPQAGAGETCGNPAGAAILDDRRPSGPGQPKPTVVAEISSPKLPLLNRP
jgi:hypothetical protein